ncbi:DUF4286 family protein [uncultured Bacteroides sp.]|uniref:DUF4286 family protein n=1 Tax=uncultured Bacteroides sp. TaxID=162156 RepID=UPI002AAA6288|nr:DUF4286 family protein [uncultured Bacteroides sp.]
MLIYNTTYHVDDEIIDNFLIWIKECYIPEVEKSGLLAAPRLCQVLSHREESGSSYSLQWEVENSALLHQWHRELGAKLNEELIHIFNNRVVGFPTLMEVME